MMEQFDGASEKVSSPSWDTKMINVSGESALNLAFNEEIVLVIRSLLLNEFKIASTDKSVLSLNNFKRVTEFLYSDKSDNESFAVLLLAYQDKLVRGVDVNKDLVSEIQMALNGFFSKSVHNEYYPVVADGVWGNRTQQAYRLIRDFFSIKLLQPSVLLNDVLKNISSRVIRVECRDTYMFSLLPAIPSLIWDTGKENLVYNVDNEVGYFFDKKQGRNILKFNELSPQSPEFLRLMTDFSCWYMLIEMNKPNLNFALKLTDDYGSYDYGILDNRYLSIIDAVLIASQVAAGFTVDLPISLLKDVVLTAILFKGDFTMQHCKVVYLSEGDKISVILPEEYFPSNDYHIRKDILISPLIAGDVIKIYASHSAAQSAFENPKLEGLADALSYEGLMGLSDLELISTFTIGLPIDDVDSGEKVEDFKQEWVMVVGTGDDSLRHDSKELCFRLARSLAKNGYGLITGGWQGVDKAFANEFCSLLDEHGIDSKQRCRTYVEKTNRDINPNSSVVEIDKSKDWYEETLSAAGALIIVGGAGGSYRAYKNALKFGVPVVPIGSSGGDALRAFNDYKRVSKVLPKGYSALNSTFNTLPEKMAMVDTVMDMLDSFKYSLPSISEKEFKEYVNKIEKEKPIVVEDDLHKNRWGGLAIVDGKILSAKVSNSLIPGFFDVQIGLSLPDHARRQERVAFFLHDSFSKEIVFKKAVNGLAITNQRSYEAFTIGALTEEGTMLELDLNEVDGFPSGFYYKSVSKSFKKKVEELYKTTPVVVKDDLQKKRWGGISERDGKKLSAKVEKTVSGVYSISIELSSTIAGDTFSGEVAFFVHNTFSKEIRYKRTRGGAARLELTAYESFTLGAFTSDGVFLELDLNEIKGYPNGFYY